MNRRNFFRNLFLGTAAIAVKPEVLVPSPIRIPVAGLSYSRVITDDLVSDLTEHLKIHSKQMGWHLNRQVFGR